VPAGISPANATGDAMTEYYTLDGIRIAHPQHGLNIVKQHSGREVRTYKVWVK
jgi:hypothetical protein